MWWKVLDWVGYPTCMIDLVDGCSTSFDVVEGVHFSSTTSIQMYMGTVHVIYTNVYNVWTTA